MTKSNRDHYKVGKGKPPVHSQFQPGQSGNPGGKKKGTTNLKAALEHALQQTIPYRENEELKTMSVLDALVRQLATRAMKGDLKAIAMVLDRAERWLDEEPETAADMPEEDEAVMQRVLDDLNLRIQRLTEEGEQQDPEPSDPQESGDD